MKIKIKINVKDITADKIIKYLGIFAILLMFGIGISLIFNGTHQESTGITEDLKPTIEPKNNTVPTVSDQSQTDYIGSLISSVFWIIPVMFVMTILFQLFKHRDY
jgi:hypothetical protein